MHLAEATSSHGRSLILIDSATVSAPNNNQNGGTAEAEITEASFEEHPLYLPAATPVLF